MATAVPLLFPWSDSYSVKVATIDIQHKGLVDLINQLHQAMATGKGKEALGKTLSSLVKYMHAHFKAEEGILQSHQYPDLGNHQAEHARFIKTITEFEDKFKKGDIVLTIEVMEFLKDWLAKHIMRIDKNYSSFLNAKGVR